LRLRTGQAVFPTNSGQRVDGLLIGTGDVIYLRTNQNAGEQMAITMDVIAASITNADFDLYVSSTNSTPDDGGYQWRGYHGNGTGTLGGAGETLVIPASGTNRTLYIGVRAFNGAGEFTLHADRFFTSTRTVCENNGFSTSSPYWANYKKLAGAVSGHAGWATHQRLEDQDDHYLSLPQHLLLGLRFVLQRLHHG
jgi:hypothetical protein